MCPEPRSSEFSHRAAHEAWAVGLAVAVRVRCFPVRGLKIFILTPSGLHVGV